MIDAPERILVEDERPEGGTVHVTDVEDLPSMALQFGTVYIRADLHEALQAEVERLRDANQLAAKIAGVWVRRAMHLNPDGYEIERTHGHMASACEKEILALTDPAAQEGEDE